MLGTSMKPKRSNGQQTVALADWRANFRNKYVGVQDMTLLSRVSNDDINANLQIRFQAGEIYTYIGHVLISVNPFRDLGLYSAQVLASYAGKSRIEMPPHVFSIAETSYKNLSTRSINQCVIISGESGAGKTEASKRILQYLTTVSSSSSDLIAEVKSRVMSTNPLLEAFGNAKTLRNNNSSRFGKYMELQFNSSCEPYGAIVTNYLLEKGRVVTHMKGERNFHIFYQLCSGADDQTRQDYSLYGSENYHYINQGGHLTISDVDDRQEFSETLAAMDVIGMSAAEKKDVLRLLSAILWLGNVLFENDHYNGSNASSEDVLAMTAYLLGVDATSLSSALVTKSMETSKGASNRGTMYSIPLNKVQAGAGRDSLAKVLYDRLFDWLIKRTNDALKVGANLVERFKTIGILDIYGFEIFAKNSFEQLCINYVNEKLQQIFVELTLKSEQEEYVRENITWTSIQFFNNKIVCNLIEEKRPPGIFSIMNDVVATAHADIGGADRSLAQRLGSCSSHQHFSLRADTFCVRHYAGDVSYEVAGMAEKNKDQLPMDLLSVLEQSETSFVQTLFPASSRDKKQRALTASDRIKTSAAALVDTLMKTEPSYIRCIKPNENKSSSEFDTVRTMHQIKYLGLLENIRVRRAGWCHREEYVNFVSRFYLLSRKTSYAGSLIWQGSDKDGCRHVLKDSGIHADEWQLGKTKVFIRHPETLWAMEHLRERYFHNMATRISRAFRCYVRRKNDAAVVIQQAYRQWCLVRDFLRLRDYGHEMYNQRKQRRRFSLISMRRFMGDYLAVGNSSELSRLCKLTCSVLFSSSCTMMVDRLLRSPKFLEVQLVVTNSVMYVVGQIKEKAPLSVVRQIPVQLIRKLSFSEFCDNVIVLHVPSEQSDMVLVCDFKTELCVHLQRIFSGCLEIQIDCKISVERKPGKFVTLSFVQDEVLRESLRQNGTTFHVGAGEAANEVSKQGRSRTIAAPSVSSASNKIKTSFIQVKRTSPPPPPPSRQLFTAMFAYQATRADELTVVVGDRVETVKKDTNGWFKAKICHTAGGSDVGSVGWAPLNYFEPTAQSQEPKPVQKSIIPLPKAPVESFVVKSSAASTRKKPAPPAHQPQFVATENQAPTSVRDRARVMGLATNTISTEQVAEVRPIRTQNENTPRSNQNVQNNTAPPIVSLKPTQLRKSSNNQPTMSTQRAALMPTSMGKKPMAAPNFAKLAPKSSNPPPPVPFNSPPPVPRVLKTVVPVQSPFR